MRLSFWCALFFSAAMLIVSCKSSRKSRTDPADVLVKTARSYTGVKYMYGGTSRSGMDCSGLLMRSFEAIDMPIPRTSAEQSKTGQGVSVKKLKKGDLVFFAAGKKKRKITHVGLVTDVRGKDDVRFIHASTKLGVVEANLMSDYYQKIYIKARRVLD
ncbi:MAG: NlpC/P60 family protein [Cyclobacteriaceae bacterium]